MKEFLSDMKAMLLFRNERDPWGYYKLQNALGVFVWLCLAYGALGLINLVLILRKMVS